METEAISKKIRWAIAEEERSGQVAAAFRGLALMTGHQPSDQQVADAIDFIREYVEHVPLLMEQGLGAAREAGVGDQMEQVLQSASAYWREPDDCIPDRLGLLGIMDDAYCSLSLIQGVADQFQQQTGRRLLMQDLSRANQGIRTLIGEPVASQLDGLVSSTLGRPNIATLLAALIGGQLPASPVVYNDPMWGTASVDEIVDARLGAMGVV
ncbi:MAG: hypothetical protein ACYS9X_17240 [Planctomycetota bacterium]|jgi:uncharacterized membrane protein YkvA (DUF1232 family)